MSFGSTLQEPEISSGCENVEHHAPLVADHPVDAPLARALIDEQFPEVAPARLEALGSGWDNTLFL